MNHNISHIRSLLSSYYDGSLDLAGENELRSFFATEASDIPEFEADRRLFRALSAEVKAPDRLHAAVGSMIARRSRRGFMFALRRYGAAAAVALLVACASFAYLDRGGRNGSTTDLTPEEARRHTTEALALLTSTMKKGTQAIETSEAITIETTQKTLNTLNSTL
ncbi:MAG: hypothetical protein NC418_03385 [Muribaculaceae bacterium]|nr:hypothetical protein [Muribaculaceae bacterium]